MQNKQQINYFRSDISSSKFLKDEEPILIDPDTLYVEQKTIVHKEAKVIPNPYFKPRYGIDKEIPINADEEFITIPPVIQVVNVRRTGRNEKCHCGSNLKFKHCHGR